MNFTIDRKIDGDICSRYVTSSGKNRCQLLIQKRDAARSLNVMMRIGISLAVEHTIKSSDERFISKNSSWEFSSVQKSASRLPEPISKLPGRSQNDSILGFVSRRTHSWYASSPKHCTRRCSFMLYTSINRSPRGRMEWIGSWNRENLFMISITYATSCLFNAAKRHISRAVLPKVIFADFIMMVNLPAKSGRS